MSDMLVSFNLASNRPENFSELCENIQNTAAHPERFEVLVRTDEGDLAMEDAIEAERGRRPFPIKVIAEPGEGYFELWHSLNRLHRELCNPEAVFVCNINDEIRFKTMHWDLALERWRDLLDAEYPDGIYRLKTSIYKLRNYIDFWECGFAPENYAFYTKRWIDVAGGDWNACHGPDAFQQFVAYYLLRSSYPAKDQINRDIPICDIEIEGEGAFEGLTTEQFWARVAKGWKAWDILVSARMQIEAKRRAQMLRAHIEASALEQGEFEIHDDVKRQEIFVRRHATMDEMAAPDGRPLRWSYRCPALKIALQNMLRRPMRNYYGGGGPEIYRETLLNIPFFYFPVLHRSSDVRQALKVRLFPGLASMRNIEAAATDHVPHAPPDLLIYRSVEPWGSAETDEDTYVWLSRRRYWRPKRVDLLTFSPGGRAHIRDVRVVGRSRLPDGTPGPWHVIPARLKGGAPEYKPVNELPQTEDAVRLSLEIDRSAHRNRRFHDVGLTCLSRSEGDRRNWLDEGRGIYLRSIAVVE